jgi:hypothetical protein
MRCTSDAERPPPDLLLDHPWLLCEGWRRPPAAPLEGGLPREKKARPALRARRARRAAPAAIAASAARTAFEDRSGATIATASDPQVPLDPCDTRSRRKPDGVLRLAARGATAKRRTHLSNSNTPLQAKTRVWDFDLQIEGVDRKLRW